MATRKITRTKSAGATAAKKAPAKKAPDVEENGDAPKARTDKLGHLTEAQRRKAAGIIFKMRGEGKPWPEVMEKLEAQGMSIPGSMTGRRLLRDYHDDGESVIRERIASASADGTAKKKATKTKAKAKVAEVDDEEEEDEEPPEPKRRVRVKRGAGKKSNPS